ncbi:MAG: hypothetical protein ACXWH5_08250 [Actinomycetota bacterium]
MAARERSGDLDRVWGLLPVLVPFLVTLTATMGAVDLAYQIRAGDGILATAALPRIDTYTFTTSGVRWLDQQWGAQVALALTHRAGGWAALVVLRAALIGTTYGLVYLACRARGAGRRTSSLLTFAGIALGLRGLALRPQLFAFPLLTASLWVLAGRRDHPRRIWWLPVFAIALANLHGAFVLVPVFAGLALLEDLIERDPGARRTLLVGLVATAATLVNPFGAGAWRYAHGIATNPVIRDTISEWRPTSVGTISGAVFAISVALLVALFIRRGKPVDLAAIAWLAVFGAIAVPASRGIVLWGLVAPTVAARMLRTDETAALTDTSRRMVAVAVALAVVAVVVMPWLRGTTPDALLIRAPVGLTEAVDRAVPPGTNLYVWQPWGSWFEFALPDDRVFVDSRIELFSAAVWHEYNDVRLAQGAWSLILRRYDVGAIVIDAENVALLARLQGQTGWTKVFEDEDGAVFARDDLA